MAWIESHQEVGEHPKTKKLARLLNISLVSAVGHLHFLWWWALDYAQDGDLTTIDPIDIAGGAKWDGDAEEFISALIKCGGNKAGFLESNDGRIVIHDWIDYAGKLIDQREKNAERQRKHRKKKSNDIICDITVTSPLRHGATVPNRTVPNQTKPSDATTSASKRDETMGDRVPAPEGDQVPAPGEVPILEHNEFLQVEQLAMTLMQRGMIYADEYQMLKSLVADGVPIPTIVQGIQESFEQYKPKTTRDKINRLTYCENHIWDLHEKLTFTPTPNSKKGGATRGISRTNDPPDDEWAKAEANFFRRA